MSSGPSCPLVEDSCQRLNDFLEEQSGCVPDDNYFYAAFSCPVRNSCEDSISSSGPRAYEACDAEVAAVNNCQLDHFSGCTAAGDPEYDQMSCFDESFAESHCYLENDTLFADIFACGPPIGVTGATCDCAEQACCGLGSACFDDLDCYSLNYCSYFEDADACRAKYPAGVGKWDAYIECATDSCKSCTPKPGGTGGSGGTGGTGGSGSGGMSGSGGTTTTTPQCSPTYGECDDSGDCSCGQSCFETAVCTTCTKRCGFSCITDQDCIDLSKDRNLNVTYTRCEKTSPNFEIYRCE